MANCHQVVTKRYRKGDEAKTKAESRSTFRLPILSESDAAGRLMRIPGMVEADDTKPSKSAGAPRLLAKGFRTGVFDIVELRIANAPITQKTTKYLTVRALICAFTKAFSTNTKGYSFRCLFKNSLSVRLSILSISVLCRSRMSFSLQ